MSDSLLVSSLGRFQVVKYIVMTLDQAAVIDHIAAVQTLSSLRYFIKVLKVGILSQYPSLVQQASILLKKR